MVSSKRIVTKSSTRRQLIDLTTEVTGFVQEAGVREGICVISVPHATAALVVNEHESGLHKDLLAKIEAVFPSSGRYEHNVIDDNADSHLAAAFLGHSKCFPILDGELVRGTWQNIFLVELDGPRSRRDVIVQVMGDK